MEPLTERRALGKEVGLFGPLAVDGGFISMAI